MKFISRILLLTMILAAGLGRGYGAELSLTDRVKSVRHELDSLRILPSTPLPEKTRITSKLGYYELLDSLLNELRKTDPQTAQGIKVESYLNTFCFPEASRALDSLLKYPANDIAKSLNYRWLFLKEDRKAIDSLTTKALSLDTTDVTSLIARGELLHGLLRYDEAEKHFERALAITREPRLKSNAMLDLAKTYYMEKEYQRSLDSLTTLITPSSLHAGIIYNIGLTLVDLSRVREAMDLLEEGLQWNPWSEQCHYFLGNGYARMNYTELFNAYPSNFAASDNTHMKSARKFMQEGKTDSAKVLLKELEQSHSKWADVKNLLGSIAWTDEQFDSAITLFQQALDLVPGYGRAHNGLAKSLEAKRMRLSIYRQGDSTEFANQPMPTVPNIDRFVANWKSLSPRHQKEVALSLAPWKEYVPILVDCGSRYYIKPLHEILSESPGLETIRDQRIDYDSRLWDDVRGAGGFITITGIEDVERTIFKGHNTVLHEMTHQVHGIFPNRDKQKLTDIFNATKKRQETDKHSFLSDYSMSSVYEYFAEGANAYYTPKRDQYDTREIVKERLMKTDTTLVHLVEYYVRGLNKDECYPVGYANAAEDALERNQMDEALDNAKKAYKYNSKSASSISKLSRIYSIMDQDHQAISYAEDEVKLFPTKAHSYQDLVSTEFFHNGNAARSIKLLKKGLRKVEADEQSQLYESLGSKYLYVGNYDEAVQCYKKVLEAQANSPNALWGMGLAYGEKHDYKLADSLFGAALLERSGIVDLRMDYARILIEAGRLADAEKQIEEAKVLDAEDQIIAIMSGWICAVKGDWSKALELYSQAMKSAENENLAAVLRIDALRHTGQADLARSEVKRLQKASKKDIPAWIYNSHKSTHVETNAWPEFQRQLLKSFSK